MKLTQESIIALVLVIVVASNLHDLFWDMAHGAPQWHLFQEAAIVVISTAAVLWLAVGWFAQQRELAQLKKELSNAPPPSVAVDAKILEARHRLGEVIHEQFQIWNLTNSEKSVALLLLKGLSFREIAAVRNTLEKTVRQQASAIYKKAGVSGRHAFSAWFIEDYL